MAAANRVASMAMRASAFLTLTLGFGILLGACTADDDHDDHGSECDADDSMRADAIVDIPGDETMGATVFTQNCGVSACHGADGAAGPAPDLAEHVEHYDADALACLLLAGEGTMPSQEALSDEELADVIAYVQATF